MSYTYPIDPQLMFEDRTHQFVAFGIPLSDVQQVRGRVTDMWSDAPGGWTSEWSALAGQYKQRGQHYLASLAYGCAKFPCLADEARRRAFEMQLAEYLAAVPTFPLSFDRRLLTIAYRSDTVRVPVHLFWSGKSPAAAPVLLLSGGVDTWKMDAHPMIMAFAKGTGMTVVAFDHPGTGETAVPLSTDADAVVLGLIDAARMVGNGRVFHFGMSFGGNFSAMSGLLGAVDGAVNLGGPVSEAFQPQNIERLPFGMQDIVGNAFGFSQKPSFPALMNACNGLSRSDLLKRATNSPMLVINGSDDYFVPQSDTLIFKGRPNTDVDLMPGTGHCAASKLPEVMTRVIGWLRDRAA